MTKNTLPTIALVSNDHAATFVAFREAVEANQASLMDDWASEVANSCIKDVGSGVVVIKVHGMLGFSPQYSLMGGTSFSWLQTVAEQLKNNDSVKAVILDMFSYGGDTQGLQPTAAAIRDLASTKPVYAFTQTTIASAAYWLASACTKVYTDGATALVGNIGVYSCVQEVSNTLEKDGFHVHEFVSGMFKALRSPFHTPSKEEKAKIQSHVDTLFALFTEDVANYRGVSLETVLKSADGQIFFAADAQSRGLTDGQLSFKELLMLASTAPTAPTTTTTVAPAPAPTTAPASAAITLGGVTYASMAEADAAVQAMSASLKASIAASRAVEETSLATECSSLYTSALGRSPTEEEKAAYLAATPDVRKMVTGILKSAETSRLSIMKAAGLTAMTPDGKPQSSSASASANPLDEEAAKIVAAG